VRAVAQWLVLALTAAAEFYQRSPIQIKFPAVLIIQLKIPFDVDTAIALDGNLCGHSTFLG
jgi:hypothetical protein